MADVRDIDIMRREIDTIPDVIAAQVDDLGPPVADLVGRVSHEGARSGPPRVAITGCGDSFFSGIATRLAFQEFAGVDATPIEALEFARYELAPDRVAAPGSILIAVSYSGEVGRTIEAATKARSRGWHTIALTGRPQGRLAGVVDDVIEMDVPTLGTSPGTSTYVAMVVALLLFAARLAEVTATKKAGADLLATLDGIPELARRTLSATQAPAAAVVDLLEGAELPVFLGSGPSHATANFGAAKILESIQRPALAQHLEEWAHREYFASGPATPTIVVAPSGPSRSRADELLSEMRFIGTPGVLVTDRVDAATGDESVLPFADGAPEALSPLLSCLPLAYAVSLLASRLGARSYGFRSDAHEREHYDTIHRIGPIDD